MKAPVTALVAATALLQLVQPAAGFRPATLQPQSRVAMRRTRGALQAVQSMPPPTTTSSAAGMPERGPWSPESWRQYTPRQMPVYDDEVRD